MPLVFIAGFDGSLASMAAVRLARRLAKATGADVLAATVFSPAPLVPGKGASAMADAELDQAIRQAAEHTLAQLHEPESVQRRTIPGRSAAQGLHELAEQENAGLIAVGATHHGTAGRIVLGSVGHRLLHGAPCPVLVAPADASDTIRTIAVAFDGEDESRAALLFASDLARRLEARLALIAAVQPTVPYGLAGTGPLQVEAEEAAKEHGRMRCEEAIADLPGGVQAEMRVVVGPPGRSIAEAAREGIDLLVTGSRAYGPLKAVLLGSTSGHLADHAACPVLIVPRGARATLDGSEAAVARAAT
jgi:nucleotide-binding universal stress UspA family protein